MTPTEALSTGRITPKAFAYASLLDKAGPLTASQAADLLEVNRRTIYRWQVRFEEIGLDLKNRSSELPDGHPPLSEPKEPPRIRSQSPEPDGVQECYEHFLEATGRKPHQYALTSHRRKILADRIRWFGPENVKKMADHIAEVPFYSGDNDRGRRYDGLEDKPYLTRESCERWIFEPPGSPTSKEKTTASSEYPHLSELRNRLSGQVDEDGEAYFDVPEFGYVKFRIDGKFLRVHYPAGCECVNTVENTYRLRWRYSMDPRLYEDEAPNGVKGGREIVEAFLSGDSQRVGKGQVLDQLKAMRVDALLRGNPLSHTSPERFTWQMAGGDSTHGKGA